MLTSVKLREEVASSYFAHKIMSRLLNRNCGDQREWVDVFSVEGKKAINQESYIWQNYLHMRETLRRSQINQR